MTRETERARILANFRATRQEIEAYFSDVEHWNAAVRKPHEEPIDPDPDGTVRRLADGIDAMLADDTGEGPIPPIGGWLSPMFCRAPRLKQ